MPDFIFPKAKTFRDPIYGLIKVPDFLLEIIHHPLFQRLRWISQMSLAQMVYPGAVHTRFEHSLGTMHLAYIAALSLWKNAERHQNSSEACKNFLKHVENEEDFIKAAVTAGLLHDVGHAPFSHVFEMAVDEYDHEDIGYLLSQYILNETGFSEEIWAMWALEALNKEKSLPELSPPAQILRTLIDSKGIDIDKGDYLLRDSHHCGVSYGHYGWERVWTNLTVIYEEKNGCRVFKTGIASKAAYEAYHLLIARFHMYEAVYEHHTKQKIDAVIGYLLRFTKEILAPSKEKIKNDPHTMVYWNDGMFISQLLNTYLRHYIEKIYRRELPKKVKYFSEISVVLPEEKAEKQRVKKDLKEKVWSLSKEIIFFPYFYKPQEPFPLESLYEVKVKTHPESDEVKPLFKVLEIRNVKEIEPDQDPEEPPRSSQIRVKAFCYDDKNFSSYKEKWNELKEINSYRSLLQ